MALSVPLLWSIAHVAVKRLLDAGAATPADVVFTRVLISTVLLGAAWAEADGTARLLQAIGDRKLQAAAALMGGLYYLELLSWFHAVKHVDVSTAASITAPSPVVTTIIAVSVLGQPIGSHQVAALAIVVMCVWGLIRASRPRRA